MIKDRIIIIDVLRGFALLLIVLIHYVEHFDFFQSTQANFIFSGSTDKEVMRLSFLLISGKAYSIFALLFGISFFIQMDNKAQKGIDYRWRFIWRMTILLIIGFLHSLIYRGDILHIYALLSLPVVFLYKARTNILWIISVLLVLQIPIIYNLIQTFIDSSYEYVKPLKGYFTEGNEVYASGNFREVISYNFWKGRITVWAWTFNNGRYLQLIALFMVGTIIGRKRLFENIENKVKGLIIVIVISIILIYILSYVNSSYKASDLTKLQKGFINTIITSLVSLSATSGIIALVSFLYIKFKGLYIFKLFSAYGKMSLTNYILQAILGVILFYDFGFSLYKYLGSTWSIILGIVIFIVQALISKQWNEKYCYGPIEWFWRCSTNLDFSIKIKRKSKQN
ncbi:DUF418 domain-containing protein [Algibacter agarivorans]|uniref:DUF418 domain-containing protein n=1 Tax=Algibacter agarivorans TaxID=1109741 RepID=A0ABP9GIS9_9FLAO